MFCSSSWYITLKSAIKRIITPECPALPMMTPHRVLDSKIRSEVHNHASYPLKKRKKKKTQHNVNFMAFIDMTQNVILCTTDTTLHFQKQAELIVGLNTLQSTITMPTEA